MKTHQKFILISGSIAWALLFIFVLIPAFGSEYSYSPCLVIMALIIIMAFLIGFYFIFILWVKGE